MLGILIKKELNRVLSDKRLIFTTIILPGLSIFLMYALMGVLINNMSSDLKQHNSIVYVKDSPGDFKNFINEKYDKLDVKYICDDSDIDVIKKSIKNKKVDLLVVFDKDFNDSIKDYRSSNDIPNISTFYNSDNEYSSHVRNKIFDPIFKQYEKQLLGKRLNGIEYINIFNVDSNNPSSDLSEKQDASGKALSMIVPMLLAIMLFSSAMSIGIDTIAGEKERGTMATLMITPIRRETIALGKVISLGILAIISSISSFIGIIAALPFCSSMFSRGKEVSMQVAFTNTQYIQLLFVLVTLVAIYVCIICLFSISAKSVKEAGTYMSPIYMVIIFATLMTSLTNKTPETWKFAIPVYGNVAALKNIFTSSLSIQQFTVCILSSIVVSFILVRMITNKFNDERTIFS